MECQKSDTEQIEKKLKLYSLVPQFFSSQFL